MKNVLSCKIALVSVKYQSCNSFPAFNMRTKLFLHLYSFLTTGILVHANWLKESFVSRFNFLTFKSYAIGIMGGKNNS